MPKGILVQVYRSNLTATNGPSVKFDQFVMVGQGVPEKVEASEAVPAMYLVEHRGCKHVRPAVDGRKWYSAGGNFVWSTDQAFREISEAPIQIFDRDESTLDQQDQWHTLQVFLHNGSEHLVVLQCSGMVAFNIALSWYKAHVAHNILATKQIDPYTARVLVENGVTHTMIDTYTLIPWWFNKLKVGMEFQVLAASQGLKGPAVVQTIHTPTNTVTSFFDAVTVCAHDKTLQIEVRQLMPMKD